MPGIGDPDLIFDREFHGSRSGCLNAVSWNDGECSGLGRSISDSQLCDSDTIRVGLCVDHADFQNLRRIF